MLESNKKVGLFLGLTIIFFIAGIFISLFTGEFDFTQVGEGRTTVHIGVYLFTWGMLIPISFKYSNHSFIFRWICALEKALQFGVTTKLYTSFNILLIISFGLLFILIGLEKIVI